MSSATAYGDASESGVEAPSVAVSQLLGPESVTWNYFGDWRGMLMGLWQGSMQNLHPKLGAAVWEYSDFFGERWQRVFRSLYPIMGVVFDQTPATGAEVRDYHRTIKGTLPDGSRYHALDPDVFYWAHATFWYGNIRCAEVFGPEISESDKRILFEESRTWYAAYGVSMRPCPDTYDEFLQYWDTMCTQVLRDHPAVRTVLDIAELPPPPMLAWIPARAWKAMATPAQQFMVWMTTGLYDPSVRELLGLPWTARDEQRLRQFGRLVNRAFSLIPRRYRLHPRARDAWDRTTGRLPASTPPIETPIRNLPPEAARTSPMHYCPVHAQRRATHPFTTTSDQ
ncbi:hypothetical protein GOPIP_081_00550 [Gordonia polyisoprenivorans NBRC 16320 = JCM 10675]|uniref:DUF2236 domain-containing protein n=1 Tax=Gordonia polyisoprenivorans TaxID=84595 RepID=A0A846WHZ3_9ACTN|nr:oxygenase MpaB family protein [Gordonia polyisoprenivorans]NKY00607.1 DUF2236 domain-containing protein [Gordonia polyisoprenivorans]GAB25416.1 hypothetical protein GOPIP_081_00550 [Gordonia polyisoprenivorans NBRC 16320 = JCM 10675]